MRYGLEMGHAESDRHRQEDAEKQVAQKGDALISIICYVIAGLLFLCAGVNQTIFDQPGSDEIAFGLLALALALALGGVNWRPAWPKRSGE